MSSDERHEHGTMVTVGEIAPDFVLHSQMGEEVRLYDILDRDHVVLYFYLRDATPG